MVANDTSPFSEKQLKTQRKKFAGKFHQHQHFIFEAKNLNWGLPPNA
jgi:hypothetical protein